jgi:hypothetical protein
MEKLKNKFGKYLQFKDTISGLSYFLRSLVALCFAFPIGILIGIGVAVMSLSSTVVGTILIILGCLFIVPMIWFGLATTYKRINALFPQYATLLTVSTFLYSFVVQMFNPSNTGLDFESLMEPTETVEVFSPIYVGLLFISLVWSVYLLFGKSKVEEHIG